MSLSKTLNGLVSFLCFVLLVTSVSHAGTSKKYLAKAKECLSEAEELVSGDKLYQAYHAYDQAIAAARAAEQFERLGPQQLDAVKRIIRQSNNGKLRIHQITSDFKDLIGQRRIANGMSKEQVLLSWGQPVNIEKKIYKWGEQEIWHYGNALEDSYRAVFFKGQMVVDWQDKDDQ